MGKANARLPVVSLDKLVTTEAQQLGDEIAILTRILNNQDSPHNPAKYKQVVCHY
jgi:hypothetical protein